MPHVWRTLPWLVLLAIAGFAIALTILPAEALFARIPINYNEGWNAFHTLRLRTGGPLYPPLSASTFINYPPLSFYVVAALHPLIGDDIFAGRVVALIAELVVALNIALAARALNVSWVLSGIAALSFIAFVAVFYPDYVAMDDPQWLGHALQTSGLVVLLRRNRLDMATLGIVALLLVLGGLIKQNLIILPLAVTIWLAIEDRQALLRWLLAAVVLVGLALGASIAVYGQDLIDQVFRSERSFWTTALAYVGSNLTHRLAPYVVLAAAGTLLQRAEPRARLVGVYLALALIIGVAFLAIDGVVYSALFDLTIAMMLGTALLFQWLAKRLVQMPAIPATAALVFALPLLLLGRSAFTAQADLALDLTRQATWQQTVDRIAAAPGPVACEMLSLCYWAGRPSEVEFFNFGQYAGLHPNFADTIVLRLDAGGLSLIAEEGNLGSSRRLPAALNAAIQRRYTPAQTEPTMLFVPKPLPK